jgi:hypothetical protein
MQGVEDIPAWFADAWGINETTAQVILSIVVIFAMLLPVLYLNKGRGMTLPLLFFFLAECLLIGIGWMPFWILIGTVAMMAMAIAFLGSRVVTGE